MFLKVRKINSWIRKATREDIDKMLSKVLFSNRQKEIFDLFYIQKYCINYIADKLCVCPTVVNAELYLIRDKIYVYLA